MYFWKSTLTDGAVAQLARAPALQAGGQEFDSPQLHQTDKTIKSQLNKLEIINNTKFRIFNIWDYKQVVQEKRGEIYEIILIVYRKNFDEVWRSNTKFRITKKAHWKIYRWKNKVN